MTSTTTVRDYQAPDLSVTVVDEEVVVRTAPQIEHVVTVGAQGPPGPPGTADIGADLLAYYILAKN